ncbi:MAG: indole-3-glycerol phosphate synthase TrpC, partial [Bacteroidales bacterium]
MNILEEIVAKRKLSLQKAKELVSVEEITIQTQQATREVISLKQSLLSGKTSGIISEFKRASPSKGDININADVSLITKGYTYAGASGLSILTETEYFKGSGEDLKTAREVNPRIPILRKDFIVDPYQVHETKAMGADVMLLIAACLDKKTLKLLNNIAIELGLDVIFEIHEEQELDKIPDNNVIIGVNNRNLKTMEVDIENSMHIASRLNKDFVLIAESGLRGEDEIIALRSVGYKGF